MFLLFLSVMFYRSYFYMFIFYMFFYNILHVFTFYISNYQSVFTVTVYINYQSSILFYQMFLAPSVFIIAIIRKISRSSRSCSIVRLFWKFKV